ncbi:hypothetical protein ACEQPO_17490 [Bacillus sp. SL00103]
MKRRKTVIQLVELCGSIVEGMPVESGYVHYDRKLDSKLAGAS